MKGLTRGKKGRMLLTLCIVALAGACSRQSASPGDAGGGAAAKSAPDRGAELYAQNCVACHREQGEGLPTIYPSLSGSAAVLGDPIELTQWVLSQKRPASIPAGRYSTQMLLFGWMKDADAAALLTYIRTHFGNSAPPIAPATVAKAREK
jgi:mono/diheme cytochrome c family protein